MSASPDELNDLRRRQVGVRVATLRRAQGMTQDQLARIAHTTRAAVSALEREGRNVTLTTLFNLADGLGVHPASLLDDRLFRLPDVPDKAAGS